MFSGAYGCEKEFPLLKMHGRYCICMVMAFLVYKFKKGKK